MPAQMPDGEPVPVDGSLPPSALADVTDSPFGVYVHVPFCASRCGYCDFNTYTPGELGGSADPVSYLASVRGELALAQRVLGERRPVQTVFFGGGTPTLLSAGALVDLLAEIDSEFGLADDAEITTEANPESVDPTYLRTLREGGFTRISLGMQSAAPGVLATLDRRHTPGRAVAAAAEAREAGFAHVNLDLIYGTPGESVADWAASLAAATGAGVDHVSAYSLIVEDGTRMARRVATGELPKPDDDVAADRYLAAENALTEAGFAWYEVSNWARDEAARCRHNLLYWQGGDWWGFGPGAHSHVGGVRWWNVKHPATYAQRLSGGASPGQAREVLSAGEQQTEKIMLGVRVADGLPLVDLSDSAVQDLVQEGLGMLRGNRFTLTLRGRLLADRVIAALLP